MVGLSEDVVAEKETLFKNAKSAIEKNDFFRLVRHSERVGNRSSRSRRRSD